MTSGITVYNNTGSVQIDSNFSNVFLDRIETHSINLESKPYVISNKVDEIVCIALSKSQANPTILANQYISNGGIAGNGYVGNVKAYVFKDRPVVPMTVGSVGMEVYTADGAPAYNTNSKPLRIIRKITHAEVSGAIKLPHENIGVVMINPKITAITDSSGTSYRDLRYLAAYILNGNLEFTFIKRGWINIPTPDPVREIIREARFLLVDLTGY